MKIQALPRQLLGLSLLALTGPTWAAPQGVTRQSLPPAKPILEVNVEHPLLVRLSAETDNTRFEELSHIVLDHALLAEGSHLDNPAEYVKRMNKLLLDMQAGDADD